MPTKQQEFYNQLRQETEAKVQVYREFQEQVDRITKTTKQSIDALKTDMKFITKQIAANNQKLKSQGQEPVTFKD